MMQDVKLFQNNCTQVCSNCKMVEYLYECYKEATSLFCSMKNHEKLEFIQGRATPFYANHDMNHFTLLLTLLSCKGVDHKLHLDRLGQYPIRIHWPPAHMSWLSISQSQSCVYTMAIFNQWSVHVSTYSLSDIHSHATITSSISCVNIA